MSLIDLSIGDMTKLKYKCSCGKIHRSDIDEIDISKYAIKNAIEYISKKTKGLITILCDENTFKIVGNKVSAELEKKERNIKTHIIKERNGLNVAPNDSFIGEVLAKVDGETDFFVAVGSGVINDIARQISYKMGKEYVVIGTAPSMDGYASITSSLILNNVKESILGQYPKAIFGQLDILANAPKRMITAGFGDVIGKYNALREWRFGRDYKGEYYCHEIASLVEKAVERCADNAKALGTGDEAAVKNVMDALIIAGMAMGLNENTRPASGAEHHIVHYWDVDCIKRGVEHELHGNCVGIGTIIICKLFDIVSKELPVKVDSIDANKIEAMLKQIGGMTHPVEAGIDRRLFKESILKGHTMSSKFTVLMYLAKEKPKLLEEAAEKLCEMYY